MREKVSKWSGFAPRGMVPGGPRRVFDLGKTRASGPCGHVFRSGCGKSGHPSRRTDGLSLCPGRSASFILQVEASKDPFSATPPLPGGQRECVWRARPSRGTPLGSCREEDPQVPCGVPSRPPAAAGALVFYSHAISARDGQASRGRGDPGQGPGPGGSKRTLPTLPQSWVKGSALLAGRCSVVRWERPGGTRRPGRRGLVFSSCGRAFPSGKKAPPFSVSLCRYSGGF